jgi:hypothetical protein
MNRVILTSEICDKGDLHILKYTSKNDFNNYFFGPNISIRLYSPKVTYVDTSSISFGFEKTVMVDNQIKDNLNCFGSFVNYFLQYWSLYIKINLIKRYYIKRIKLFVDIN